ncbi:MAG: DUF3307 domain-containing protein [candidate division WOR-3 bacterium]
MNSFIPDVDIITILLLGHLLGDFIFQTDQIFRLKIKSKIGLFLHSFFILLPTFVSLFLFSKNFFFSTLFSLFTFFSHYFIDLLKSKNNLDNGINFILDQLFHFFVILFLSALSNFFILQKYKNGFVFKMIYLMIGLIFILYFLKYLIRSLYGILRIKVVKDKYYYYIEEIEKIFLFIFSYMHGYFFLCLPFMVIPRIIYSIKKGAEYLYYDILISFLVCSFSGIFLRKVTLLYPFSFFEIFTFSFSFYLIFKLLNFIIDYTIILFEKRH